MSTMSAQKAVTQNKTKLQAVLTADYKLILNKVHENKLLTVREYNKLKLITGLDIEGHVIELVDRLINKGEDTCKSFLFLLQNDSDINDTFPSLVEALEWCPPSPSSVPRDLSGSCVSKQNIGSYQASNLKPCTGVRVHENVKEDDHYKITSRPCGLCLIINNESFNDNLNKRCGTNKDAEDLAKVLHSLHFKVVMCKDQTKDKIEDVLKLFSLLTDLQELHNCGAKEWSGSDFIELNMLPHHGDAFICCILSHGAKGCVYGTCGEPLTIQKITSTFNGRNCRALIDKPKVFFIQACQGHERQQAVVPDGRSLEADANTPEEADILVAIATVQNYAAFRHSTQGSWFIQSLCSELEVGCHRGDDIFTILARVNDKVSKMLYSAYPDLNKKNTQIPEFRCTLRRKLVFPF